MAKSTIKKSILLIVIYCLLFSLPKLLNQHLLDYTFNQALAQLTLALFMLSIDYRSFKHHVYNYPSRFTKTLLLFLLSCCVYIVLFLLHVGGFISLPYLFTRASNVPFLLAIMECFSIYFCMHINEGYLFHTIQALLPSTWNRNLKAPISFILFCAIHIGLIAALGMGDLPSQAIYYVSIGGTLMILNYFNSSFVIYAISALLMLLGFTSL